MADPTAREVVAAGRRALAAGEWETARDAFLEALLEADSAEAFDGLGLAMFELGDIREAVAHRQRAYSLFRKAGRTREAAEVARWLARQYSKAFGNETVAQGWLARAEGLSGS